MAREPRPLVSVIVRSMARGSLAECLASIRQQDYPDIEIVVVAACGAAHPPLPAHPGPHAMRFVRSDVSLTRPRAAQAGVDASAGTAVTFLDDDDVFLPGHVAGLVAMRAAAPEAGVVYGLANACFRNGHVEPWGQPFALAQLYERSFIHLSTSLVDRALYAAGCRFDETLDIMEDWDFFLQCAQHTPFHFEPRRTFEWHADAGSSGAGGGANSDDARFAHFRDRVYSKWDDRRTTLRDFVEARLHAALARAASGDAVGALSECRAALVRSANDPWALNIVAMVHRSAGRMADARAAQELAVAVRPQDASLVYNLAVLCRDSGDVDIARAYCTRALALRPDDARARALAGMLDATIAVRRAPTRISTDPPCQNPTRSTPSPAASPPSSTRVPPE